MRCSLESTVLLDRVEEVLEKAKRVGKEGNCALQSMHAIRTALLTATCAMHQLALQKAFVREERRRVRMHTEAMEERKKAAGFVQRSDWLPHEAQVIESRKRVKMNIGGLVSRLLLREYDSLISTRSHVHECACIGIIHAWPRTLALYS
jgi:hypothetical protein